MMWVRRSCGKIGNGGGRCGNGCIDRPLQQVNSIQQVHPLLQEHAGDAAFEFLIIMCVFATTVFLVVTGPAVDGIKAKVQELMEYITNSNHVDNSIWLQ